MIGIAPEFTDSKYFVAEPEWHLKDGASSKDKADLEKFMNSGGYKRLWKDRYPKMTKPYYTWNGEVVDKG